MNMAQTEEASSMPSTSTGTTPVHRVRFVDYDPSPITALVFPPLPFPSADPGIAHAQQQAINKKIRTTAGSPELTPELVAAAEFGCLICARQNGQIDIWEYVGSSKNGNPGNWVLSRVSSDKRRNTFGEAYTNCLVSGITDRIVTSDCLPC